jgi:hypothetical protein
VVYRPAACIMAHAADRLTAWNQPTIHVYYHFISKYSTSLGRENTDCVLTKYALVFRGHAPNFLPR